MPYAREFFADLGELCAFKAGDIKDDALQGADVLLTRSTTKVDENLLQKAPCLQFVGTATAGTDHFDIAKIEARNIPWAHAPGCNAKAVAEYVCCALLTFAHRQKIKLAGKSIGVVGVGHVGQLVADLATALNMQTILCDPPRAQRESAFQSASLENIRDADFISLHVPLINSGEHKTEGLISQSILSQLTSSQVLINACRGEVVDDATIDSEACRANLIFDCWHREPNVALSTIQRCLIATPHIAGHSLEGKARGTEYLYHALCRHLQVPITKKLSDFLPPLQAENSLLETVEEMNTVGLNQANLYKLCKCFYDIENDDSFFRTSMAKSVSFSELRSNYPTRREFDAIVLHLTDKNVIQKLRATGFNVSDNGIA